MPQGKGEDHAKAEGLLLLALRAPMARLARMLRKADAATVSRRSNGRLPELRPFILDGDRIVIDADELNAWLIAKADEYLGKGTGYLQFMNAGRVDGYWTVAGTIQQFIREARDSNLSRETPNATR